MEFIDEIQVLDIVVVVYDIKVLEIPLMDTERLLKDTGNVGSGTKPRKKVRSLRHFHAEIACSIPLHLSIGILER